ncbi:GNAT family N-acetyltransferase [Pseudomonas sp. UL073]|uniref:GNAT family N-acetyltransferase n=1 Tax=Zestomonas insulae TaxID=2809017 RepID=A0ABS2IEE1_9GAMM|nr:N-acetyltransferase [Pseudomonas insulae]MBM7061452.1 GNAT family N-acetyltransferase [Pseudomonas insulae]
MSLTFRPAVAADATQAVPLIYSSGPLAFDYVFDQPAKGSALDFLHFAFRDGRGEFGFRQHWVGELEGRVVAVGTAFSGVANLRNSISALRQILSFYGPRHGWSVIGRGLRIEQLIRPPSRSVLYLAHLGVVPALTGQGIGGQLIAHLLQQAEPQALRTAALDVAASNPLAQRLYERLGFRVCAERASAIAGLAAHRYMERPLSS